VDALEPLLHSAADAAIDYLAGIDRRPVVPSAGALMALGSLGGPLPDAPTEAATVLAELHANASPATIASAGGRYFGFVTGGTLPAALASAWLAAAWDQNGCLRIMSPAASRLEEIAAGWLVDLLGLPAGSGVGFVTGATMGNFTALAAARHALLDRAGWDVGADGLFDAPPVTVVVGDEVHVSLLKALAHLGFGRRRVVRVPVDDQGRMRPEALPALDERTVLCLQAGNVNTGASDPFGPLTDAAAEAGAWVHVDGAFGLWLAAAPDRQPLVAGVERADSWSVDGHKWLNVSYDAGYAVVRDAATLASAMAASGAAYLGTASGREPEQLVPEMSRRARGVETWAAIRSLGRQGVADLVEHCCRHAARLAAGLVEAGFEVVNDVVANQVLVTFGPRTPDVVGAIQADGTCWCGASVWQGRPVMRISVSSWRTTDDDVDASLAAIVRVARRVLDR
jgi:glutamate/tyrosine decarboxylase-like PLP-dependent enzyme